jgi:thiamine pyrophosphate-dependent acetolactate synthase large subunit-like protein
VLVAEAVGRTLAGLGVQQVFGVVGSGNFHVTNALVDGGARFVAARHEAGAATMADAYARVSRSVAAVSLHQGCGLTNALTGVTEAAKSRTPLLVLAAEAASRSTIFVDQAAVGTAVGAVSERVCSAETAVADAARAYRRAVAERRTVLLNLPLDVQAAPCPPSALGIPPEAAAEAPGPPAEAVRDLATLLARARRPVFLAGRGARLADARASLEQLADACGALLATSVVAKGLFAGNPWSLDVSGAFATPLATELISAADVLVGWGCALNMWTMRHGRLVGPDATVVQVDVDPEALGAHRPVDLGMLGDVDLTARAVIGELATAGNRVAAHGVARGGIAADRSGRHVAGRHVAGRDGVGWHVAGRDRVGRDGAGRDRVGRDGGAWVGAGGYRSAELRARIAAESRWRDVPYSDESDGTRIDPRTLTIGLDDRLPADRVVAVDSGNFMGYPSMFLSVPDDDGFCFTQAYQSVGLGLATAIGAALARPDRLPVAACGDGGFLMSIAELDTAVRLGLPLVAVVYNDDAYGAEVHQFGPDGFGLSTVTFPDTDIAAIGRGYGCSGMTVRTPADLKAVDDWLAGPRTTPLVIDAKVTTHHGSWWLEEAFRDH